MIYCFYVAACLFLVILQTAVLPHLPLLSSFYDLLIPFIIYLALYRPLREGLLLVILLGFIMDNISGSPFGLYLTTYCWLLIGVIWTTKFVQVGNRVLLSVVVAAGVLIENLLFMGTFTISGPDAKIPVGMWSTVAIQLLWALGSGPFFLLFFKHGHQRVDNLMDGMLARQK
jgi:rod shape-determining protein MreD